MEKTLFYNKIKEKNNQNFIVLSLINKYFWKTKIGPIFSLSFPFLIMLIYYAVSSSKGNSFFINSFPTIISLSILPLFLITLPALNIEFRSSILLRKIKTIGISKIQYLLLIFCFFSLFALLFSFISIFLFCIFLKFDVALLKNINWGILIYGLMLLIASGIFFGILISILSKNPISCQLIGFGIMIMTLILSGQFIPISVIGEVNAIKYISLFSPLSYSSNILNIASINTMPNSIDLPSINLSPASTNLFNLKEDFYMWKMKNINGENVFVKSIIYTTWQKTLFTFMPFVFCGFFASLSIKYFKWTNR